MRAHYDFDKLKGETNSYARQLKQPVTIRLDKASVGYFKAMAAELGMPYQNLINLYLRECMTRRRKLSLQWESPEPPDHKPARKPPRPLRGR